MSGFKKAKREQLWLKILLSGSSGSGKSYSALRLATGISQAANGKVAAIDTENGRIRYYANEFDFDDMQLAMPYSPEKYIDAIDEAIDGGYTTLIIDSISHEWFYCLDIHSKMPGNSYANWGKVTPRHDRFMEKILQSPIHMIVTVRGKDDVVIEEKNGKQAPKKIGVGYQQRNDIEYNYTVSLNIDQKTHIADVFKDNTHLFEDRYEILTERDGKALYEWANTGDAKPIAKPVEKVIANIPVDVVVDDSPDFGDTPSNADEVKRLITEKAMLLEADKKKIFTLRVKAVLGIANYNKCEDIDKLNEIMAIVESM